MMNAKQAMKGGRTMSGRRTRGGFAVARGVTGITAAATVVAGLLALSAAPSLAVAQEKSPGGANPFQVAPPTSLSYDREFPVMHYADAPADNPVAALQRKLDAGQLKLEYRPGRGYLDSLLKALAIDVSSQVLVYSKTSLQTGSITAATPRAIYFDTDTYVGYVQPAPSGARLLEIATLDAKLGQVFYTLDNSAPAAGRPAAPQLDRQTITCLACHDTYELSGGGVPRFLLMSSYVDIHGNQLTHEDQILTEDDTPLKYRWGGWYVSGRTGSQVHVGNLQVHDVKELVHLDAIRKGNLDNLDGLFDTSKYPTDKSDVVALMVLQHQVSAQNAITRANFEVRQALAKTGKAGLDSLPAAQRKQLDDWVELLAEVLTFTDIASVTDTISGNSGFDKWFQAQGPKDGKGRSLRELNLHDRLFRYPVSYVIQTPAFDALPDYVKQKVYTRVADVLQGKVRDSLPVVGADDRKAALDILRATKPDFAKFYAARSKS